MKIGIWLGNQMVQEGGATYSDRFIKLVDTYSFDESVELCYLSFLPQPSLHREVICISQIPLLLYRIVRKFNCLFSLLTKIDHYLIKLRGLESTLAGSNVKIVFYLTQATCIDSDFPFISNNWDLGHRSTHSFPEITMGKTFENRDRFYFKILPKSLLTICESETGKKELIDLTGLGAHKIRVMPLFAGGVSSLKVSDNAMSIILNKLGLQPHKYFYYPAQFWPHKNHIGLLRAFKKFLDYRKDVKLVCSGSDRGNKEYVYSKIIEYELEKNVVLLGFISEEEVLTLYKNSLSLVMASHFGPTNMPPIEAMELGCPVVCSDLGGHREILGESAVYFDSFDDDSILRALIEISNNRKIWNSKIEHQKMITQFKSEISLKKFNEILLEAVKIRENWDNNYKSK